MNIYIIYVANSVAFITEFRTILGPIPYHNPFNPFAFTILVYASQTPLYLLSEADFLPSACNLILTKSFKIIYIILYAYYFYSWISD